MPKKTDKSDQTLKTTTPAVGEAEEEALTTKQLHAKIKDDYQHGMSVDQILAKYGNAYPLKKSTIINVAYPDSDAQKKKMVDQYEAMGE